MAWAFATAPDSAPVTVPLIVIAGDRPGPVAALTAGIHGDEYEGIVALWRLAAHIQPEQVAGRILIVPIAHQAAYNAATRSSPSDGVNLARVFPGDADGTITYRLAHHLFANIVRHASVLVDCHSGGVRMAFAPVAGYYREIDAPAAAASLDTARWMGLPNLWAMPPRAGVLSYEAARIGVAVSGCEIGGRGGRIEADSQMYYDGITRVLRAKGILAGEPGAQPTYTQTLVGDWVLAPAAGLLENHVELGERVKAGARLATIYDTLGAVVTRMSARTDGFVMGVRHLPAIQVGEWATCVVEEKPL